MSRFGNALLWSGCLALVAFLGYAVSVDPGFGPGRSAGAGPGLAGEVAVFYPEHILWQEFRQGVSLCARRGLVEVVEDHETVMVLRTPRQRRLFRVQLHDVRGIRETAESIGRWVAHTPTPLAVVGSSNTALTVAIAQALRDADPPRGGGGPVLLVPWASAVLATRSEPGEGPVALLDIDPGRTFRFCLNNQYQADLLVRCVTEHERGRVPRRAVVVEDRQDPYSVDLAASFHRSVEKSLPSTEITETSDLRDWPLPLSAGGMPTPEEESLAGSICRETAALPSGQTVWVFLPLQEEPALRILQALRHQAVSVGVGPRLRVVCGDSVGARSLAEVAGQCPFSVWGFTSMAVKGLARDVSADAQIPAEIVSALSRCLDLPGAVKVDATSLRDALAALRLGPGDPGAVGRSLAFSRTGERVGDDLGHVLWVRPDDGAVYSLRRTASGGWTEPEALPEGAVAYRP